MLRGCTVKVAEAAKVLPDALEGTETQAEKRGDDSSEHAGCPALARTRLVALSPVQVTLISSPKEGGGENVMVRLDTIKGQDTVAEGEPGGGTGVGLR